MAQSPVLPLAFALAFGAPLLLAATWLWLDRGAAIALDLAAAGVLALCH
jgi:hypothetical protein